MKKTIANAAFIDARNLTPEAAKTAPEIHNAALILVSERSKELLMEMRIRNVANVVCVPEDVALYTVNGVGTLGVGSLDEKKIFVFVNGKLGVSHDVTPEMIVKHVAGGVINGKLLCAASQLTALQSCGMQINGKAEAYPDGCRLREGNRPLTAMEANAFAKGEKIYLCQRVLLEKGALDRLIGQGIQLFGAGIMIFESEAEKAGMCWQGDPSCVRLVKDECRVLVEKQYINRRNAPTFRGALDIIGDVFIDSDVEAPMLESLQSLRVEGELWTPMALMQTMMEKVDGDVEWMPYEGALIRCGDILTLGAEMVDHWPERVTLYNSGMLDIQKDLQAEALQKKIALMHNTGKISLTSAQHGALQMVITGSGFIDERPFQEEKEDPCPSDAEGMLGNAAWLVL